MKIEKNDELGGAILNCAVRYSLGRTSYMPGLVMDEIRPMLPDLSEKTLYCMERDIREWLMSGDSDNPYYGEWRRFREDVERSYRGDLADDMVRIYTPYDDYPTSSQREMLERIFKEWANEQDVAERCCNVVRFLSLNGLLDLDAVEKFIAEKSTNER